MKLRRVKDLNKKELEDMYKSKMLQLIVDINMGYVYHVPSWMKHIQAVEKLLGIKEEKLNKDNAGHLVSVYIEIEGKNIRNVIIGVSSFELGCKIHHSPEEKAKAEYIINKIINLSRQLKEVA